MVPQSMHNCQRSQCSVRFYTEVNCLKKYKVRVEFDAVVYADNEVDAMEHEELFDTINILYIVAEEMEE